MMATMLPQALGWPPPRCKLTRPARAAAIAKSYAHKRDFTSDGGNLRDSITPHTVAHDSELIIHFLAPRSSATKYGKRSAL